MASSPHSRKHRLLSIILAPLVPPYGPAALLLVIGMAALLIASVFLRVYRLDSLPGITGDEAWLGVAVLRRMSDPDAPLRTFTRNFISPFLLVSEWLLLSLFPPSLGLLRWPAAGWNLAALPVFWLVCRRAGSTPLEAALATVTVACHPLHLGHSRLGWDPSFLFVVTPMLLLAAMGITENGWRPRWVLLLVIATLLCLWVHMVSVVFVALTMVGMWAASARLGFEMPPAQRRRLLLRLFLAAAIIVIGVAGAGILLVRLSGNPILRTLTDILRTARTTLTGEGMLLQELASQASIVSGWRVFETLARKELGMPALVGSFACLLLLPSSFWFLFVRSRRPSDWLLGAVALAAVPALVVLREVFNLESPSHERYVLWMVPLFALVLTRVTTLLCGTRLVPAAAFLLIIAGANVGFFVRDYVLAIERLERRDRLPPAFWTGPEEPKSAAARIIAVEAARTVPIAGVWADGWDLYHPLRFLFFHQKSIAIHNASDTPLPAQLPEAGTLIVVAWPGNSLYRESLQKYPQPSVRISIPGGDTRPGQTSAPILEILIYRPLL